MTDQRKKTLVRKKCCNLAKKIARIKQNFTCEYCHRKEPEIQTHGSHIYAEGTHQGMSADVDNILCLCYTHHLGGWMNTTQPSWHKNPLEMVDWFKDKYPERYQRLKERSQKAIKVNWDKKLMELQDELNKIMQE